MAITATVTKVLCNKGTDGVVTLDAYVTNSGTYATSGHAMDLSSYMTTIVNILFAPSVNGYTATYNHSTSKVILFDLDSEVANAEANTEVFRFQARGY